MRNSSFLILILMIHTALDYEPVEVRTFAKRKTIVFPVRSLVDWPSRFQKATENEEEA